MKIKFNDKSYIEAKKSTDKEDHIIIMIGARDFEQPSKIDINMVELTPEQFKELIKDLI